MEMLTCYLNCRNGKGNPENAGIFAGALRREPSLEIGGGPIYN